MQAYLDLLKHVLDNGVRRKNRTGVDTIGVFGHQIRVDLRAGFPLLTTKKLPFRWIVAELLWFLSGSTDEKALRAQGVDIWKEWATPEQCAKHGREAGDLGPIYGWQWRHFGADYPLRGNGDSGWDQIAWLECELVANPGSRRLVVSAWNPADARLVALPPCHTLFQLYVGEQQGGGPGVLSCHLYARSIDSFLGLPFNLASYSLLTHALAHAAGLAVGDLVISFGDLHLYENHLEQAHEQLDREPRPLPRLFMSMHSAGQSVLSLTPGDFSLVGYDNPHPAIKAEVAV
jgi:thymidylate synthase